MKVLWDAMADEMFSPTLRRGYLLGVLHGMAAKTDPGSEDHEWFDCLYEAANEVWLREDYGYNH